MALEYNQGKQEVAHVPMWPILGLSESELVEVSDPRVGHGGGMWSNTSCGSQHRGWE